MIGSNGTHQTGSTLQQLIARYRRPMRPMLRNGSLAAVALVLGISTALVATPSTSLAATPSQAGLDSVQSAIVSTVPSFQDDDSYVFTLGQLIDIDDDEVTIRLANGETLTYDVDDDTEVRDQDGDEKSLDDLDVGEMVVIVTEDDDNDALSIIEGGPTGFRQGGPFDLQHQGDERGQWRQQAHPNVAPPFTPRQRGPAPTDANQPQAVPVPAPAAAPAHDGLPGIPGPSGMMPGPGAGGPAAAPHGPINAGGR